MKMFEEKEVATDLDARLIAAGIDPLESNTIKIKTIVSGYYAERTSEVLEKVREVLAKFDPEDLH